MSCESTSQMGAGDFTLVDDRRENGEVLTPEMLAREKVLRYITGDFEWITRITVWNPEASRVEEIEGFVLGSDTRFPNSTCDILTRRGIFVSPTRAQKNPHYDAIDVMPTYGSSSEEAKPGHYLRYQQRAIEFCQQEEDKRMKRQQLLAGDSGSYARVI